MASPPPLPPPPPTPRWVLIVGAIFGFITLAFFMMIALLPIAGFPIPCDSRFPVIIVLAICAAFASGFLGGYAKAEGTLPIPFVNVPPVAFGVTGGLAALIIVMLFGYWLYVANCDPCAPPILHDVMASGSQENPVLTLDFEASGIAGHFVLRAEFSSDEAFKKSTFTRPLANPENKEADVAPPKGMRSGWVRLSVYDTVSSTSPRCHSTPLEFQLP